MLNDDCDGHADGCTNEDSDAISEDCDAGG